MSGQFRILPLLIFVAMLTFSVRLAEFVTGVSHLSGSAYAEENEKPSKDEKAEAEKAKPEVKEKSEEHKQATNAKHDLGEPPAEEVKAQDTHESSADANAASVANANSVSAHQDSPKKWQDAGDSDMDVTAVKMEVLEDISRRSAKLDAMEKNLQTREALLKATEQEINRKYQELSKLRTEIEGLLGKQSEEEQKRVTSLVKIYEGMKPKEAARIFDTLDLDILVSVVSKMSERKISPILGLMDPERAKTLTIMLAQQKQLPSLSQ